MRSVNTRMPVGPMWVPSSPKYRGLAAPTLCQSSRTALGHLRTPAAIISLLGASHARGTLTLMTTTRWAPWSTSMISLNWEPVTGPLFPSWRITSGPRAPLSRWDLATASSSLNWRATWASIRASGRRRSSSALASSSTESPSPVTRAWGSTVVRVVVGAALVLVVVSATTVVVVAGIAVVVVVDDVVVVSGGGAGAAAAAWAASMARKSGSVDEGRTTTS